MDEIADPLGPAGRIVMTLLILPAFGWGVLVYLSLSSAPVYVLLVAGMAAIALLDGQRATRRRLARAAVRAAAESVGGPVMRRRAWDSNSR
jgi:hypothetical protein